MDARGAAYQQHRRRLHRRSARHARPGRRQQGHGQRLRGALVAGTIALLLIVPLAACTGVSGHPTATGAGSGTASGGATSGGTTPGGTAASPTPDASSPTGSSPDASSPPDDPTAGTETAPVDAPADPNAPPDTPPTATELIAAAVESGDLDPATALLYRTWALFGDPALPADYRGAPAPHDLGLFADLRRALPDLPDETRAHLEPYLLRPSDPGSAFSAGNPGEPAGLRAPGQAAAAPDAPQECTGGWYSQDVPGLPFRTWVCWDLGGGTVRDGTDRLAALLTKHASDMMAAAPDGLGRPIPDEPDADPITKANNKIDVYVLPEGWFGPFRDGEIHPLGGGRRAATVTAPPRDSGSASGYILLGAGLLAEPDRLEVSLVHEVFHVLQFAHRADLTSRWFEEASAVWASTYYAPDAAAKIHPAQLSLMQTSPLATHAEAPTWHPYAAYLWPLFMQQEAGPEAVFGTWTALESAPAAPDGAAVIAAIDSQLDIAASFDEFALRLLNADLDGDPIRPRFADLVPAFPDGAMPPLLPRTLTDEPLQVDYDGVPGLGYRYTWVDLDRDDTGDDTPVGVRISGDPRTDSGAAPSVQALVQGPSGEYSRRMIDLAGTEVCLGSNLILVVANPSTTITDRLGGAIELERFADPDCGLVGELQITFDAEYTSPPNQIPTPDRGQAHWTGTLALALGSAVPAEFDGEPDYHPNAGSHWTMSGSFSFERCVGPSADPCIGAAVTRQEFSADADLVESEVQTSADPDEGWSVIESAHVRLELTDDGPVLRAQVPVRVTTTIIAPNLEPRTSTDTQYWTLSCPGSESGTFWSPRQAEDLFAMPDGDDLLGSIGDDGAVTFDCSSTWPVSTYHDGSDRGSATFTLTGTVRRG